MSIRQKESAVRRNDEKRDTERKRENRETTEGQLVRGMNRKEADRQRGCSTSLKATSGGNSIKTKVEPAKGTKEQPGYQKPVRPSISLQHIYAS